MTTYHDAVFLKFQIAVNDNGIVTDFYALHARERCDAVTRDENRLRRDIEGELGINPTANGFAPITDAQAEEAETLYLSACHGEAQLRYDEIMERHRADWDKYY
jgi:hypothetical protein